MALTVEQNREVIKAAITSLAAFDATLLALEGSCSQPDFDEHKRAIAKVMGEISWEILNPIFERHPELEPQSVEEWLSAGGLPPA